MQHTTRYRQVVGLAEGGEAFAVVLGIAHQPVDRGAVGHACELREGPTWLDGFAGLEGLHAVAADPLEQGVTPLAANIEPRHVHQVEQARRLADVAVLVGPVRLPSYLERAQMARLESGGEIELDEFNRWLNSSWYIRTLYRSIW